MRLGFVLFFGIFLGGCGLFHPFVDARKEAGKVQTFGQSTEQNPAICYHPFWTEMDEVDALAERECQKEKKHALLKEKNYFSCTFFAPNTVFYECQK